MFSTRKEFASNDEIIRQQAITDVIIYGNNPTTLSTKKAAAIFGHKSINVVGRTKIRQTLDYILTFISSDDDLLIDKNKERIRNYLKSVNINKGTSIILTRKPPIFTLAPELIPPYNIELDTMIISPGNIGDFEYLCFNNNIRFRYLKTTGFAAYMFQNLLHSLNAASSDELIGNELWQAQLAILLERTEFNNYIAMQAFYDDQVLYRGVVYDTSFVPKYAVKNLDPQDTINPKINGNEMITYYYSLNERKEKKIPTEMMGIFLTFPFKNGHYIRPTGEIVHLQLKSYNTLRSSRISITNMCNLDDIESAIESVARSIPLNDAIYHAVYSKNLNEQSIALLIIRRLVGNTLTIGDERINIPTEINVLSWSKKACTATSLALPIKIEDKSSQFYLELIQDIAESCGDKLTATLLCHQYMIPEMNITDVYSKLKTDAERYILFTLILQEYRHESFYSARKKLNPKFGKSVIDLSKYPPNNRMYNDTLMPDRLDAISTPLLVPSDSNSGVTVCNPYNCMELYEFVDPQLNELVRTGDVSLDAEQLSNLITLIVY